LFGSFDGNASASDEWEQVRQQYALKLRGS
jgi:hypothetical protein